MNNPKRFREAAICLHFPKGVFISLSTLKSPVIANKNTCLKYKYDTSTRKQLKANERDIIVFKKIIRLAKFQ